MRSNLVSGRSPEELWHFYIQLTQVEGTFKDLKDDLNLRPIRHQLEGRIEAHIFISFLAYCLHVTLRRRLHDLAPGLTARAVLGSSPPSRCSMSICRPRIKRRS